MKHLNDRSASMYPSLVSGRYWGALSASYTNSGCGAGIISYVPLFVPKTTNFDRISIQSTTAAAGNIILGLYSHNVVLGRPGNLLFQSGNIPVIAGENFYTNNFTLKQGNYWTALISSIDQTVTSLGSAVPAGLCIGGLPGAGLTYQGGIGVNQAFGPLPAIATFSGLFYAATPALPLLRIA
jgi:hypothetical protein